MTAPTLMPSSWQKSQSRQTLKPSSAVPLDLAPERGLFDRRILHGIIPLLRLLADERGDRIVFPISPT